MGLSQKQLMLAKSFSNAGGEDQYEAVYETRGAQSFNLCNAAYSSGNASAARKYEAALISGYKGTFEDFKKERLQSAASTIGGIASGFMSAWKQNQNTPSDFNSNDITPEEKSNTGAIVISILAITGLGLGIYLATKK